MLDKIKTIYLPYKGGSIYGKGTIRKTNEVDNTIYNYVFENSRGSILFNDFNSDNIKGFEIIFTPEEFKELFG